ncbi:hypothetical protein FBU31_000611 [Coemansia sp. 'formosensis']|nr:hypothetical protein FBU31_000611 [Coemansia sp. 'formosensis']
MDISKLLFEISERRSQAVALARALEQSVFIPQQACGDTSEDDASDLLCEDRSLEEAPDSFLDDFTRDFVDFYYTPPDPQVQAEKIRALCQFESEEEDHEDHDEEYDELDEEEYEERDAEEHQEHEKGHQEHEEEDQGVSRIDYAARQRIWSKIGKSVNTYNDEEARIVALVERAEQMSLDLPATSLPPKQPVHTALAETPVHAALTKTPVHVASTEPPANLQRWVPNEWEQWATYKASGDCSTEPLEWVHALQPNAWEHGFRDTPCGGGKLLRTYSGLPLTLHSYADGNVKRTATLKMDSVATTLFFANGDWSCTVVSNGPPQSYYYYCDERVWHEQCGDRQLYKYSDGSVDSGPPHM